MGDEKATTMVEYNANADGNFADEQLPTTSVHNNNEETTSVVNPQLMSALFAANLCRKVSCVLICGRL